MSVIWLVSGLIVGTLGAMGWRRKWWPVLIVALMLVAASAVIVPVFVPRLWDAGQGGLLAAGLGVGAVAVAVVTGGATQRRDGGK
ncbi:MAG: hypothetical protein FWD75_05895 [Propionibacteriaceae bacterium]|nr:hypothetical protein [Propionibacteriaceae bacterium]